MERNLWTGVQTKSFFDGVLIRPPVSQTQTGERGTTVQVTLYHHHLRHIHHRRRQECTRLSFQSPLPLSMPSPLLLQTWIAYKRL